MRELLANRKKLGFVIRVVVAGGGAALAAYVAGGGAQGVAAAGGVLAALRELDHFLEPESV